MSAMMGVIIIIIIIIIIIQNAKFNVP